VNQPKQVNVELAGSKLVTCKEANKLLKEGKIWKIFWRPDGQLSHKKEANHNNDPAYVWFH
jgi:hypothetical protein